MTTKVVTGKVRFSYAHVFEPYSWSEDQTKKYSVSLIIPKTDTQTIAKIQLAVKDALEEGKSKFGGKIPATFKHPLRDGDTDRPDDANYANSFFVNANSARKPGVVDANTDIILDKDEFYSGCYGRASINFYAYNVSGSKGVAAGLNHVQKICDGENLSGNASTPQNDFSDDLM